MLNVIYDLGPVLDPRDEALIDLLSTEHGIAPCYIGGHAGLATALADAVGRAMAGTPSRATRCSS